MDTFAVLKIVNKSIKSEISNAKKNYGSATIHGSFITSLLVLTWLHLYLSRMYYNIVVATLIAFLALVGLLLMLYLNRKIARELTSIHLRDKDEIAAWWKSVGIQQHYQHLWPVWRSEMKKLGRERKKLQRGKGKERTKLMQLYQRKMKKLKKLKKLMKAHVVDLSPRILVAIWLPVSDKDTGHASLLLMLDDFINYISHYPKKSAAGRGDPRKKLPVLARNLSILDEWRPPDIIITIPNKLLAIGSINKIKEWSDKRQLAIDTGDRDFKLKFENCSDTVKMALAEGGFILMNPIFRFITLGMTLPKLLEWNILYTIALKNSNFLVRYVHSGYMLIVFVISLPAVELVLQLAALLLVLVFIYCNFFP